MQRIIKFRTWETKENRFIMMIPHVGYIYPHNPLPDYNGRYIHQQFTGLKDSQGKEIYEGDIIKFDYKGRWETDIPYHKGEIIFTDNSKSIDDFYEQPVLGWHVEVFEFNNYKRKISTQSLLYILNFNLQIIGNIFENPELLNVK